MTQDEFQVPESKPTGAQPGAGATLPPFVTALGLATGAILALGLGLALVLPAIRPDTLKSPMSNDIVAAQSWRGKRVVPRSRPLWFRGEQDVDERTERFAIYVCTEEMEGPLLFVRTEPAGPRGWVSLDQVIAVEEADEYFSGRLRQNNEDAFALAMRGLVRQANGNLTRAVIDYSSAIQVDPPQAWVFELRALAQLAAGETKPAITDATEAIRLDPQQVRGYIVRSRACSAAKEYNKALADLDRAFELEPQSAAVYEARGAVLFNSEKIDDAILQFARAIELDTQSASAYHGRGRAWRTKKVYDEAIADFDETIRLDPWLAAAYLDRGQTHNQQGNIEMALGDFNKAIELSPRDAQARLRRALIERDRLMDTEAIADLDEVISLQPKDAQAHYARAVVLRRQHGATKAAVDFIEALRLDLTAAVKYYRGLPVSLGSADFHDVVDDLNWVIEWFPKHALAYVGRGIVRRERKEFTLARGDFAEAARVDANCAAAHFYLAAVMIDERQPDQAVAELDLAMRLDPGNVDYRRKAAEVRFDRATEAIKSRDYDRVIASMDEVIRLDPKNALAFQSRGSALAAKSRSIRNYSSPISTVVLRG
jgi:tetratricopeptide (TPR) repeat protein